MSFASKYNKKSLFTYDVSAFDTYFKLSDLGKSEHVFPVHALYVLSKGEFDPHPLCACDGYFVSLPAHLTDTVREILDDEEAVAAINSGLVGFKVYTYKYKRGGKENIGYSVNWVDLEDNWKEEAFDLDWNKGKKRVESGKVEDGEVSEFNEIA